MKHTVNDSTLMTLPGGYTLTSILHNESGEGIFSFVSYPTEMKVYWRIRFWQTSPIGPKMSLDEVLIHNIKKISIF